MKKFFCLSSLIVSLSLPLVAANCNKTTGNQTKPTNPVENIIYEKNLIFEPFFDDLKDSATNEFPSIFVSRNAAQYFISSFIQLVGQLELSKNDQSITNKNMFLIDHNVWQYENRELDATNQRFNLNYLLNSYGDKHLKQNGKLEVFENTKYLDPSSDTNYLVFPRTVSEIENYLKEYLDSGVSKFDFYIPDISLIGMDKTVRDWIIKRANKIVILSDGNAQPYKFIRDKYLTWVEKQKTFYSKEELIAKWIEFQNSNNENLTLDWRYFLTLTDKFKIYNLDSSYIDALNQDLENKGFGWAKLNINQYPLTPTAFYSYFPEIGEKFIEQFNKVNNLENKTFLDFIVKGQNNYDPNKKNLIFMGSSLFRHNEKDGRWRLSYQQYALDEIRSFFNKVHELYPRSEYNYFFKLHPVYNIEQSVEYINMILGENSDDYALILNSQIAWENMLAVDFTNLRNNKSILFDSNKHSKTELYGLQATTTTILSTMTFLKTELKWNDDKIKSFVDIQNFPLSNKFNIITRDIEYKDDDKGFEANKEKMNDVYKYFINSGSFPNQNEWIDMRAFLKRTK
ncbi:hypothetical protein [Mycoplasmopsis iners]|uniref:hypothetical protein n=1 Tax=Mycoplasmopsis iners TaxID=76630 RepID=UPI000496D2ED|nr:hypothetical protein [Mycoplasmopsis iners]